MSKAIMICYKDQKERDISAYFKEICSRITPDNIKAKAPLIFQGKGIHSCVYNPVSAEQLQPSGFYLGVVNKADLPTALKVGTARPDGTFAVVRSNSDAVECLSDYTAMRSIWYYHDDDVFMASTSQRMMVAFLGSYDFNPTAASWMLATGSLGPGYGWDKRFHYLPGNQTVRLDRSTWKTTVINDGDLVFKGVARSKAEHRKVLEDALEKAIHALDLGSFKWSLALSGGMDSRSLLYYLKENKNIDAITWGLAESMNSKDTDAALSSELAKRAEVEHHYAATDYDADELTVTFNRFLNAGEGRIDHLPAYMDGLKIWRDLYQDNRSIIRGYDAMGKSIIVQNDYLARRLSLLTVTTDFKNSIVPQDFELTEADIPVRLRRRDSETLDQYRDRLWLQFRTPFITAALDDIKVSYVEIVNPLLSRHIVETIQTLPNELITNKVLFGEIVDAMFPGVPYAKRLATQSVEQIFDQPEPKQFLREQLHEVKSTSPLPGSFLEKLSNNLDSQQTQLNILWAIRRKRHLLKKAKQITKTLLPRAADGYMWQKLRTEPMDVRRVSLRALIISRMYEMLNEDAKIGRSQNTAAVLESK